MIGVAMVKDKLVVILLVLTIMAIGCSGPEQVSPVEDEKNKGVKIDLWPKEYLGPEGNSYGVLRPSKGDNVTRITDVSIPSMTVYKAKSEFSLTPAVMVCPGGGYSILAIDKEGTEIADWLNSQGVTAIVLKYRVSGKRQEAFKDAQRGLSIIRSRSQEFNIDPDKIGVIGFSAGGHLAARLSGDFNNRTYEPVDEKDSVSCRPDFSILIYPAYIVGKENDLSKEIKVSSENPPTFIVQTQDDGIRVENSIYYYLAARKASVPSELHVFPSGGHGYGMRPTGHAVSGWPELCNTWMRKMEIITP